MKIKLAVLLSLIMLCIAALTFDLWAQKSINTAAPVPIEQTLVPVPDFKFTTVGQQTYTLHALPEPGILLNFWASWCAPCQVELPAMIRRVKEANGALALVAVSIDDRQDAMEKFIARQKLSDMPHTYWVWDEGKTISLKTFNTSAVPETILINSQRQMVDKIVGDPGWDSPAVKSQLKNLASPR